MLPELIVLGTVLGVLLLTRVLPADRQGLATGATALAGMLTAFLVVVTTGPTADLVLEVRDGDAGIVAGFRIDAFAVFCRGLIAGGGVLLLLLGMGFTGRARRGSGTYHAALLLGFLGAMLASSVRDLVTLFISLQLVTVAAFVLVGSRRDDLRSSEAGLKFLVLGGVSSAILLLGIGLLYGWSGSVSLDAVGEAVWGAAAAGDPLPGLLLLGMAFLMSGLLFTVGGVPLQGWVPDVFQGAPSEATAFLATTLRATGVILLLRLAQAVFVRPVRPDGEGVLEPLFAGVVNPLAQQWVLVLGVIAVVTLLLGVLAAIPQRDIKRMLAYLSIAQAGYLLMGVVAIATDGGNEAQGAQLGAEALLYALMAHTLITLVAFAVILVVGRASAELSGGAHDAEAYAGLGARSPLLAVAMGLALVSLAGVPPLSGFFAKFLVLRAAVDKGLFALAFIGAGAVLVSLYVAMQWLRRLYVLAPAEGAPVGADLHVPRTTRLVLWIGMLGMVLMGIWMPPFYDWVREAATALTPLAGW